MSFGCTLLLLWILFPNVSLLFYSMSFVFDQELFQTCTLLPYHRLSKFCFAFNQEMSQHLHPFYSVTDAVYSCNVWQFLSGGTLQSESQLLRPVVIGRTVVSG